MNEEKRKIALKLIQDQHYNLDLVGLDAAKQLPHPQDVMAEAMLYHFKSCFRVLELILEGEDEQSLN